MNNSPSHWGGSPACQHKLPLAYPCSSHPMNLRSQSCVPFSTEPPTAPNNSLFSGVMPRSNSGGDRTPIPESPEDNGMGGSPPDSVNSSPCARLGASSQIWPRMDTPGPSNIWGARTNTNASDGWFFKIYEDPVDSESPRPHTPDAYAEFGEDKENIFATGSDYNSPVQPEPERDNDLARLTARQQDAFGVLPYSQALINISLREDGVLSHPASAAPSVPTPTETLRPAMRIEVREEEEIDPGEDLIDLEEALESGQVREIQRLSDVFVRGVEDRMVHGRQYPMRDDVNIQGTANIFMEARRITHYQRHQSRRTNFEADE